ncbi:Hpt domain-containing protein [Paenarthrobacter sp. NPDC090520]|uniref:Hpt domain-containing protein n=1 Tax=Paenarthrobacter sp. NPDC090520 TaxID=3364382 RepID=UPI00382735D7
MSEDADGVVPVLDQVTLTVLAEELNDTVAFIRFLERYFRMLPGRTERILHALEQRDTAQTMDAVLSLRISSAMVGALGIEEQCRTLQDMVHSGAWPAAALQGSRLQRTVDRFRDSEERLLREGEELTRTT